LEPHHLDLPIKRYAFLNLYTNLLKRIKDKKSNFPNLLGLPGRPESLARPTAAQQTNSGEIPRTDTRAPLVIQTETEEGRRRELVTGSGSGEAEGTGVTSSPSRVDRGRTWRLGLME
jgi:hypothetical protein